MTRKQTRKQSQLTYLRVYKVNKMDLRDLKEKIIYQINESSFKDIESIFENLFEDKREFIEHINNMESKKEIISFINYYGFANDIL